MKKNKKYETYKIGDHVRIEWQEHDGFYEEVKGTIISLTEKSFLVDPDKTPLYHTDHCDDFVLVLSSDILTIKKV